jgi:hypothetical protein
LFDEQQTGDARTNLQTKHSEIAALRNCGDASCSSYFGQGLRLQLLKFHGIHRFSLPAAVLFAACRPFLQKAFESAAPRGQSLASYGLSRMPSPANTKARD